MSDERKLVAEHLDVLARLLPGQRAIVLLLVREDGSGVEAASNLDIEGMRMVLLCAAGALPTAAPSEFAETLQ